MAVEDLDIVDSQVHIWGANRPERPWPAHLAWNSHGSDEVTAKEVIAKMDVASVAGALGNPGNRKGRGGIGGHHFTVDEMEQVLQARG